MRTLSIGDIHARTIWKDIVEKEFDSVDKVIFIGDYFDTFEKVTYPDQIENMKDILNLKYENPDKVTLLIGNHDIHYLNSYTDSCSGFNPFFKSDINEVLSPEVDKGNIKVVEIVDDYVYTHAGLTKTWCKKNKINLDNLPMINDLLIRHPMAFRFKGFDFYGDDVTQGPLWVRPDSLLKDRINRKQVVGHTYQKGIDIRNDIIFIDVFDFTKEYLIIDNVDVIVKRLK